MCIPGKTKTYSTSVAPATKINILHLWQKLLKQISMALKLHMHDHYPQHIYSSLKYLNVLSFVANLCKRSPGTTQLVKSVKCSVLSYTLLNDTLEFFWHFEYKRSSSIFRFINLFKLNFLKCVDIHMYVFIHTLRRRTKTPGKFGHLICCRILSSFSRQSGRSGCKCCRI